MTRGRPTNHPPDDSGLLPGDRDPEGFTIIEVLIAVTILGFVLLAVVPLLVTTLGVNRSLSLEVKAHALATQGLEELKSRTADQIEACLDGSTSCTGTESIPSDIGTDHKITFTRQWRIDRLPLAAAETNPSPVVLTATVLYTYQGEAKARVFTSMWAH